MRLTYSAANVLSTTTWTGLIDEPSVMSMKRTLELLRTDLTHPETSTSGTLAAGPHALRSATVLMSRWHSPGTRTE